jgi:hypothetical protein
MLNLIISLTLPPLLVFGLYHLMTWVNILNVNARVHWKRVALASAVSHLLLVTGFFVFTYFDYQANRQFSAFGLSYGDFLFNGSQFWRMVTIFDTAAMAVMVGLFAFLDRFGIAFSGLVPVTIAITYVVGSLQWYFLGGGIGALLEKFWSGLKTGDEEEEEWFQ